MRNGRLILIEPAIREGDRGFFQESFEEQLFWETGITERFVQSNHSRSKKHVLHRVHFTRWWPQARLPTVFRGTIFDTVADLRKGRQASANDLALSLATEIQDKYTCWAAHLCYKACQLYDPLDEGGLLWNDSEAARLADCQPDRFRT